MGKMKSMSFLFVLFFLLILTGCGSEGQDKVLEMRVAGQYPADHPESLALLKFKEDVESETNGNVKVNVYLSNQLGDYSQVYEEGMKGSIEMALIDIPSEYDAKLEISYLNYLSENYEQARKMFGKESVLSNTVSELHENLGVKWLGFSAGGFGGLMSTKEVKEPLNPEVSKGIQIRVPPITSFRIASEDMGFNTISIPFAELYTSLQTGVVDGAVGAAPVDAYTGYSDVMKHYIQYNHFFQVTSFIINNDLWEDLGTENQKIIENAVNNLSEKSFDTAENQQEEYLEKMREAGINVTELTDAELEKFAKHIREVSWPKHYDSLDKEVIEKLLNQY